MARLMERAIQRLKKCPRWVKASILFSYRDNVIPGHLADRKFQTYFRVKFYSKKSLAFPVISILKYFFPFQLNYFWFSMMCFINQFNPISTVLKRFSQEVLIGCRWNEIILSWQNMWSKRKKVKNSKEKGGKALTKLIQTNIDFGSVCDECFLSRTN